MYCDFCQYWSRKTGLRVLARSSVDTGIKLSRLSLKQDNLLVVLSQSSSYFSVDRKFCFKSFRLDRRDKGSKLSFRRVYLLFVEKVSRMDRLTVINMSGTGDRFANCRKSENSPFWSKKRAECIAKICALVAKKN